MKALNTDKAMTVKELITILSGMPQDLPVLVSGYESGFEHFYHPTIAEVVHCPENMYYDGEYQIAEGDSSVKRIQAILLDRMIRDD